MEKKYLRQAKQLANTLKAFAKLVEDKKLISTLDSLNLKAEEREYAEKDIEGYLKKKGIKLPQGMKATFRNNNWSFQLCDGVDETGCQCCLETTYRGWRVNSICP